VEPLGATSRIIAPHFRATVDGFLVWGSFPRLVRTGIKVDPEGLPHVPSRLILALLMPGFIPLGSFGRWEAQSAPTPRTSSISATRLVHTFKVTIFARSASSWFPAPVRMPWELGSVSFFSLNGE